MNLSVSVGGQKHNEPKAHYFGGPKRARSSCSSGRGSESSSSSINYQEKAPEFRPLGKELEAHHQQPLLQLLPLAAAGRGEKKIIEEAKHKVKLASSSTTKQTAHQYEKPVPANSKRAPETQSTRVRTSIQKQPPALGPNEQCSCSKSLSAGLSLAAATTQVAKMSLQSPGHHLQSACKHQGANNQALVPTTSTTSTLAIAAATAATASGAAMAPPSPSLALLPQAISPTSSPAHHHSQAAGHQDLNTSSNLKQQPIQATTTQPTATTTTNSTPTTQAAQASSSGCSSIANPDTRTHVVGELYDTERSYVESLQILVEKYMKPLKSLDSNRILIDSNLVDEIFYTIPEILQHHENFLSSLQDRLSSDWDTSQVIGNVFIEAFTNQQIMDTYTAFINNWKNARQAIKVATQAKPAFERYLEAMSREHRNKLTLDALLIMPVQRIPRYELLIKELLKHTPEDHPDYGPLIEAQKEIHELALKIDCAEREMIHQEQLKDIESLIEGHVELQHPQRDFIRYDLVTILGGSALTVAKKERVLFLFCDLLIMTSIKKKASRRSNLQSAFANSSNDLSLLEGNKFKLLLRVPLDQVEIRLENDQIQLQQQQQQQQQQEQQHQLQLQQQSKIIQENKRAIEADLYILHQIESLSSKMKLVDRNKISEAVNEFSSQLRERLFSLEQSDIQTINKAHQTLLNQAHDLYIIQPSAATNSAANSRASLQGNILSTTNNQPCLANNNNSQFQSSGFNVASTTSIISSSSNQTTAHQTTTTTTNQLDSNTSLEFIISNSNPAKESQNSNSGSQLTTIDQTIGDQVYGSSVQSLSGVFESLNVGQHQSNCETLVVTFSSLERRHAFLQAFIDAKQQRYQMQQQQRQQQQQRMYSSSITLQLAQPGTPNSQRNVTKDCQHRAKLQCQENVENCPLSSANKVAIRGQAHTTNATTRISSAPIGQHDSNGPTIVHQMSAPQSLALTALSASSINSKERSPSQCTSCSSNLAAENENQTNLHHHHHHHHHHHQLIHQPASHPSSLQTICCRDQHNNDKGNETKLINSSQRLDQLDELADIDSRGEQNSAQQQRYRQSYLEGNKQQSSNIPGNESSSGVISTGDNHSLNLMGCLNQALIMGLSPKFFITLPMNFLNTQHPALKFTCSTLSSDPADLDDVKPDGFSVNTQKRLTVKDNSGQLWLCMSNGYVSHVALITMQKRKLKRSGESSQAQGDCNIENVFEQCYTIVPIVQSAGDICKSHINCATQVKWTKKTVRMTDKSICKPVNESQSAAENEAKGADEKTRDEKRPQFEMALKSASPPISIGSDSEQAAGNKEAGLRLSESAPSHSVDLNFEKSKNKTNSSASTGRLELPPQCSRSAAHERRSGHAANTSGDEQRRSLRDLNCQRHHHNKHLPNRPNVSMIRQYHSHPYHTIDHHTSAGEHRHHHHYHHHSHHHHLHGHHVHHAYGARHNTVPLAELRRALERQNEVCESHYSRHLAPPANTPANTHSTTISPKHIQASSLSDHCARGAISSRPKLPRAVTPPGGYSGGKSFRSARLLRHQASLKTSSILAKLVSGASKHSSYLRKSGSATQQEKQSDVDDNDTDTDTGKQLQQSSGVKQQQQQQQEDNSSIEGHIQALTTPGSQKCSLNTSQPEMNSAIVSPLSSVSSLNSTTSSITMNSVCASLPNRSACDLVHSASATCCVASYATAQPMTTSSTHQCEGMSSPGSNECRLRSRSATVPSRSVVHESIDGGDPHACSLTITCNQASEHENEAHGASGDFYKVSDIIGDHNEPDGNQSEREREEICEPESSLWLGCEDGSLIIIDCLTGHLGESTCSACDVTQRTTNCGNSHTEVRLNAPVCDICTYKDKMVLVSLSNGQLAIFSRNEDSNIDNNKDTWSLTNPKLLTITAKELNSTSKLCLINDEHLWYSYGRNIFVLNIGTLKLETTIMTPTNDLSLQFTMQSITIDNMILMSDLFGVWVSFKNSHLVQLYDVKNYKLLVELNLFEPVNKILSYGNEIIRQHKTACLKATSLLNIRRENCNTIFIGTSAGIVLYLNITNEQLALKEPLDGSIVDWNPQVAALRHGHSGNVKFLNIIEVEHEADEVNDPSADENNNNNNSGNNDDGNRVTKETTFAIASKSKEIFLISGGSGIDLYGPSEEHQAVPQLNTEEDNLNHLLLWQL